MRVVNDELVAVYDESGAAVGAAPRSRVRAEGLWHAAGVVLVRSPDGAKVYVHLRTATKDIYPSTYDCWAGGLIAPGETPLDCARRELAEELGIRDAPLEPLFVHVYDEPPVHCHNFAYEVRWDGPITHQPEEIVSGEWLELAELRRWAEDPESPLIPDGRLGILEWLRRFEP